MRTQDTTPPSGMRRAAPGSGRPVRHGAVELGGSRVARTYTADDLTARQRGRRTAWVLFSALAVATAVGISYWHYSSHFEDTDDAQVDGHIHPVNTRVAGTVEWVNPGVEDTYFVDAGTTLARLDANDYAPEVDRLRGDLVNQQATLQAARFNVPVVQASAHSRLDEAKSAIAEGEAELSSSLAMEKSAEALVHQAEANWRRAEDDRRRYEELVRTHEISRSEYDQHTTEAATTHHQIAAAQASLAAAHSRVDAARKRLEQKKAEAAAAETAPEQIAMAGARVASIQGDVLKSQASLRDAQLNLSYTTLTAPVGGIVGRRSVEVGQRVAPGQLLMTIVPLDEIWITAYYKETQLRHMRKGQPVTIHVDSDGRDYGGHVESIGGATGSRYSILPPENATGNYVKVVQRIPVRIRLDRRPDAAHPLLPGMSVETSVRVR